MIRVKKLDILRYIQEHGFVEPWQIREHFGYSDSNARRRLSNLKKQELVINMLPGQWELTLRGQRRLIYYDEGKKEKGSGKN